MVDEAFLELEQRVVLVDLRRARQVVVLPVGQAHDAEVVRLDEGALVEGAVAEGVETLPLPSELCDLDGGLRLLVEIPLELDQAGFVGLEDVVSQALDPLAELGEAHQVFLFQLDDLAASGLVAELVEALGVDGVLDVEQRLHGEVRPSYLRLAAQGPVAAAGFVEAVFGEALLAEGLVLDFLLLLRFAGLGDGPVPHRRVAVNGLQLVLVTVYGRLVVGGRHHRGDGLDAGGDGIHVLCGVEQHMGVPDDEVLLLHLLELGDGLEVAVGVLLDGSLWDGLDQDGVAALDGLDAPFDGRVLPRVGSVFLGDVGVGQQAQGALARLREAALQQVELVVAHGGTERCDGVGHADDLHTHHVGSSFGHIHLPRGPDLGLGHVDSEQRGLLVVELAVGGVDVFADVFPAGKVAAGPALDLVGAAPYGDGDAVVEGAVVAALLGGADDVQLFEQFEAEALFLCPVHEGVAAWGVAYAGFADVLELVGAVVLFLGFDAPAAPGVFHRVRVGFELFGEPGVDLLRDHQHGLPLGFPCNLLGGAFPLAYLDVGPFGQPSDGFGIAAPIVFHHPLEHVAVLAASEAVVGLPGRAHCERAGLLGMERAAAHKVLSLLLQFHRLANELHDVNGFRYPVDV